MIRGEKHLRKNPTPPGTRLAPAQVARPHLFFFLFPFAVFPCCQDNRFPVTKAGPHVHAGFRGKNYAFKISPDDYIHMQGCAGVGLAPVLVAASALLARALEPYVHALRVGIESAWRACLRTSDNQEPVY